MSTVLNAIPIWLIMVGVATLILMMNELGAYFGRLPAARNVAEGPSTVVQAASFTLVGLLLAFSFSLALGRYDARRAAFVQEANSIGTTFLRTELLGRGFAAAMRSDLRDYVELRIDFAKADADVPRRLRDSAASGAMQRRMWERAMQAARSDPHSTMVPLFISALNDTIDLSTTEGAILSAHIPDIVMIGLILMILIAAVMMGFNFGLKKQRAVGSKIMYALVLTIAIGLVSDLDRPQRGFVRVDLTPMVTLQRDIANKKSDR
jgi:hypothetical protein